MNSDYHRSFGDILNGQADSRLEDPNNNQSLNFFSNSPTKTTFSSSSSNLPPLSNPLTRTSLASTILPKSNSIKKVCSQCREGRSTEFPIRLTTLEPYLICRSHSWYWTEAVKYKNWAPEFLSNISDLIFDLINFLEGNSQIVTWAVEGVEEDRQRFLEVIERAGNWESTLLKSRASRATSFPPPAPIVTYYLTPPEPIIPNQIKPAYKLSFTFHQSISKFVIALKPEVAIPRKEDAAWKKKVSKSKAVGGGEPKAKKVKLNKKQDQEIQSSSCHQQQQQQQASASTSSPINLFTDPSPLAQLAQVAATLEFVQNNLFNHQKQQQQQQSNSNFQSNSFSNLPESSEEELLPSSTPHNDRSSPNNIITPPKKRRRNFNQGNIFVEDLSPGSSEFDELDSSPNNRERERDESVSLDELEEESEEEEGDWLVGLVRNELM